MAEKKKISPLLVAGIGAGAAIATGAALYLITRAEAAPPTPPPGLANLYGFVTDALTGLPIPQVQVTLDGLVRYTGTEGQYEIRDLVAGQTYHLNFSKEGYQPITRDIVLSEELNEVSVQMALILPTEPCLVDAYPAQAQVASGGLPISTIRSVSLILQQGIY
jgi:hypothetical protein